MHLIQVPTQREDAIVIAPQWHSLWTGSIEDYRFAPSFIGLIQLPHAKKGLLRCFVTSARVVDSRTSDLNIALSPQCSSGVGIENSVVGPITLVCSRYEEHCDLYW